MLQIVLLGDRGVELALVVGFVEVAQAFDGQHGELGLFHGRIGLE